MKFGLGDPVVFRRWPGAIHEQGRIVSRTISNPVFYDVEIWDGRRYTRAHSLPEHLVSLDEGEMHRIRQAEGVA